MAGRRLPNRRHLRAALLFTVVTAAGASIPRVWCGRSSSAWLTGDVAIRRALGDVVAARATHGVKPGDMRTGSDHFDGEWALVTNQMAVLGLGQIALQHPAERAR